MEQRHPYDAIDRQATREELLALWLAEEGFLLEVQDRIAPRESQENPPLSFAQQRLWFLNQLMPGNPFYNVPGAIQIRGELVISLLERSINEIVRRHEVLRTTFPECNGQPHQVIVPQLKLTLPVIDLGGLSQEERETVAQALIRQETRQPFHLATGPLIRITLVQRGRVDFLLLLDMHHIVCDGWSMGVFFHELAALYQALRKGEENPLADLPIQYADYALWQRDWIEREVQETQLPYWLQQLQGAPALLELPTDFPRPTQQSFRGALHPFVLPAHLSSKCKELAHQTGTTLFMVLLAVFAVLLSRYTRQSDLVVGSPIANRTRPEIEKLVGFFVNTLALRIQLAGNPTFLDLLEHVKEVSLGAYAHQDLPFERLVEELQPERSLSHTPLVQILFAVQNIQMEPEHISGLTLEMVTFDEGIAPFDLSIFFKERGEEIAVDLVYSTDLFAATTIKRMEGHLCSLLEGAVTTPHARIADLPLLTMAERVEILQDWNQTEMSHPAGSAPHQLFEAQAQQTPDRIAICFEGMALSYGLLDQLSNQLAHYLRKRQVGPEIRVGLCIERSLEMIIALLAVLKTGAAYVPLDPDYPQARLAFMLSNSRAAILLTSRQTAKASAALAPARDLLQSSMQSLDLEEIWPALALEPVEALTSLGHAQNLGYVIYTSGSTGHPKGVALSLLTLTNLVLWQQATYPGTFRSLQFTPLSFDVSYQEIFSTLCSGGTLVVPTQEQRLDPEELLALVSEQGIEQLFLPFVALQSLADAFEQGSSEPSSLRHIFTAGEQLRLTASLRQMLSSLPGCRLYNHYGPAETHVITAYTVPATLDACPYLPPIGRPIANGVIYVLDQYLNPVPVGVPGEIYLGGMLLARGYLDQPDLTAERFLPDPLRREKGARMYRTGDLARYLVNGDIEFLGRADFQVKVRGYRIEPGEIEARLEQHPGVQEALVVVDREQADRQQLVAYLIPAAEQKPSASDLRRWLLDRLPEYMLPAAFVQLASWPLTASGKVDRRALPAPRGEYAAAEAHGRAAPRDPVEEMLHAIWTQILGREDIGIHHNFFELGGHSLLATQVMSRVRKVLQVEMPLRALFESPTIAELSEAVRRTSTGASSVPVLRKRQRDDLLPMSFAQQRMWFLNQLLPDNPAYNLAGGLRLVGALDVRALERSLQELVARHEALRTGFGLHDGQPIQFILPNVHLPLSMIDLQSIASYEEVQEQLAGEVASRIFDLHTPPLLCCTLLRIAAEEHVLLLCLHHSICDGWSLSVFFRELAAVYAAFAAHRSSPLAPLALQYADYALWQREWLQGEALEAQLSYWRQALADLTPLALPLDYPRPVYPSWQAGIEAIHIPLALSRELKALSQREGVTLFMILLATFQVLLWRYCSQDDITVGTPVANRNHAESEHLIGCLVNTLVLRSDLSGNPTFRVLLQRVRETCLQAYAHQDLPFEKLVEELQPERELSLTPLFQVLFALHNLPDLSLSLPGLQVTPLDLELEVVKFDLNLSLWEQEELTGHLRYNADVFAPETIKRMLTHWYTLLGGAVANPDMRLVDLPLLSAQEEHLQLSVWNSTTANYAIGEKDNLVTSFQAIARCRPDALALVGEQESLSYGELERRANLLAGHLCSLGVGLERVVGLWMESSLELFIGMLAVLKAGGAYLPLDPATPVERLHFLTRDAAMQVLLTRESFVQGIDRDLGVPICCLEALCWEHEPALEQCVIPSNAAAYILYTSGSTGRPKGVIVTHHQILNYVEAIKQQIGLEGDASYGLLQPLMVDSSLTMIWGALLTGGRLLLIDKEQSLDAEGLSQRLTKEPIAYLKIAPSHLAALLTGRDPAQILPRRALIVGGEPLRGQFASDLVQYMADGKAYNHYGPTEAAVGVSVYPLSEPGLAVCSGPTPLGRPLAQNQLYILDDWMRPVPIGIAGELYIGGAQVARGYLGRADLTAACFVPDPYGGTAGARLYRTGDVVRYRADGVVEFVGRRDEQVKIRGYRVEPGEVEAALSQHPLVREALVLVRQSQGQGKQFVAYILAQEAEGLSQEVMEFARERLPEYMLPRAMVILDRWPRTPHGKIDRQALPLPDLTAQSLYQEEHTPQTELEKVLATIWKELLGLEWVGRHDNFFELGGDSILSIRVVARARQAGLILTPRQLFQAQSIAALAALIGPQQTESPQAWQAETGLWSCTPVQCWFFEQRLPPPQHWNLPLALKLSDDIDESVLKAALQHVCKHHPILRGRCVSDTQGWHLALSEPATPWPWIELCGDDRSLYEQASNIQAQLSLTEGPLGCAVLLRGERERHLLWIIHHLLVDAISWGILLEDLQIAYQALQRGQQPDLLPVTTSAGHWSDLLRDYARSAEFASERAYWLDSRWEDVVEMPVDLPLAAGCNVEGLARTATVQLTAEETRALLHDVPVAYHTRINDVLLAALLQSYADWTGEEQLLLELEGHGREELFEEADLSRSVGWFTSRYPVLLTLPADGGEPGDVLLAVKEQLQSIPHHGIGYGVLRYLSQDQETRARLQALPQARISFNYVGRLDAGSLFELSHATWGPARSPLGERNHWLEIIGEVVEGMLALHWTYSEGLHSRETIERLAAAYLESLRTIIVHCQSTQESRYTPADFPLARLDEQKLRKLEKLLSKEKHSREVTG